MNEIKTLIISDSFDFTTDYICIELKKRNVNYFRLNRNKLSEHKIIFDVNNEFVEIIYEDESYLLNQNILKSVYFRAPTYLRETYSRSLTPEAQLYNSQWMAFIRNLIVFENCVWINNPVSIYKAENKIFQLHCAKKVGFLIPITKIINYPHNFLKSNNQFIAKSIDTAILKIGNQEAFVYSNILKGHDIINAELAISPVVVQNYLNPKIDIRVTIADKKIYAVEIKKDENGVAGDWRKYKNEVDFIPIKLSSAIENKCISLLKELNLLFGAIDLALHDNKYYFFEVNPTGEWAWLVDKTGYP